MLTISLVGTGGMFPLPDRFLTACMVRHDGHLCLVDCGEGTQVSLKILGWGFKQISCICFTHFHADHISGLPGLLLTIGNAGREEDLQIIGPKGVKKVVENLSVIAPELPFSIQYQEISKKKTQFQSQNLKISTLPVKHGIPCFAYRFSLLRQRAFQVEKAKELGIPMQFWSKLQKGEAIEFERKIYRPEEVLGTKRKGISFCYATDLRPSTNLSFFAKETDLFICEGNYADEEKYDKALKHKHCLFSEAAQMAKDANTKELWLTHFSPSLLDPDNYLEKASRIFSNTFIGKDRMFTELRFENKI